MHLYLHIPFCKQACHYCDFHFSTSLHQKEEMVSAIIEEMALQKNYLEGHTLKSIYLGGGTPSLLENQDIARIFKGIHTYFSIAANAEITLEANPDDIKFENLKAWKNTGVNRLSIGIQSFDKGQLKFMNRSHDEVQAENCIKHALEAGFDNFSVDLIYGIPADSHEIWEKNLEKAIAFDIKHLSAYCLSIEEKTVFGRRLENKKMQPLDEEFSAEQFEALLQKTQNAGLEQYEISNFSRPGFHARHNSSYWFGEPYLGIGPSAHSFNGRERQWNVANNAQYLKSILQGKATPYTKEILNQKEKANELIMTSLRTKWGLSIDKIKSLGLDLYELEKKVLDFENKQLISRKGEILTLTTKGKLQADHIASELFFA